MKLWLISQTKNSDYDTYDSAVVVADTEDKAKSSHPSGFFWKVPEKYSESVSQELLPRGWCLHTWAEPKHVKAEYIGETDRDLPNGTVILASFNAG